MSVRKLLSQIDCDAQTNGPPGHTSRLHGLNDDGELLERALFILFIVSSCSDRVTRSEQ